MIHVCYSLRDESGKYSKFAGTSIQSLLDNTSEEVTIHLIHDSTLSKSNRKKFLKIVYNHEQEIKFYNVEELIPNCHELIKKAVARINDFWAGLAGFYRTLIPDFLPADASHAIYLDTDILVNLDIAELWKIDLEDKLIGAIPEAASGFSLDKAMDVIPCKKNLVDPQKYFNSGVMVFNLDQIRKFFGGGADF